MNRQMSISLDASLSGVVAEVEPNVAERCGRSLTAAPLGEADAAELARVLAALADPVRLRLVSLVAAHKEICSCNLERPLGKSQPTISHHTKVLAEAGLLVGERRGRWVWWRVDEARLAQVRAALGAEPAGTAMRHEAATSRGST